MKIIIYNQDNYLFVNISKFIDMKINLFVLIDNVHLGNIKKGSKEIKVVKQMKIKEIDLKLQGLNFDYRLNGGYFGLMYAIFGFLDSICKINGINLNYDLRYQGDKSVEFKSIIRARVVNLIRVFQGI